MLKELQTQLDKEFEEKFGMHWFYSIGAGDGEHKDNYEEARNEIMTYFHHRDEVIIEAVRKEIEKMKILDKQRLMEEMIEQQKKDKEAIKCFEKYARSAI